MGNKQTGQGIYESFGRGDIPAILERLAENVEWETADPMGGYDVPWLQPRRGRQAVAGFFQALAPLEFLKFEPKQFLEDGDTVVALVDLEVRARGTTEIAKEIDEVHIWRFNAAGQVKSFRHRVDTKLHSAVANRVPR
jgi:ketosteroid isomerase-like protein